MYLELHLDYQSRPPPQCRHQLVQCLNRYLDRLSKCLDHYHTHTLDIARFCRIRHTQLES